jgi:hemerythrin superfamily protein
MAAATETTNAVDLILQDHRAVKKIFADFEKTEGKTQKKDLVSRALVELKAHAIIEEEIFYPAVREKISEDVDLLNEADEEHHVAKILIAELDEMTGSEDHFDAKFTVLAESVRHHMEEEEGQILPKAEELGLDLEALGQRMLQRKQVILSGAPPTLAEAAMVETEHLGRRPRRGTRRRL